MGKDDAELTYGTDRGTKVYRGINRISQKVRQGMETLDGADFQAGAHGNGAVVGEGRTARG